MPDHILAAIQRVVIVGSSGSGKSTLAGELSRLTGLPHIQLDALHHMPDWEPRPREELTAMVDAKTSDAGWIVDGNYLRLRPLTWGRATLVIWLDYPFLFVAKRLLSRTVRRVRTGEEVFNGNRETVQNAFLSFDSVLVFFLRRFWVRRRQYGHDFGPDSAWNMTKLRLCSQQETETFLKEVASRWPVSS